MKRNLELQKTESKDLLLKTFLETKDAQVLSRVSSLARYWSDKDLYPSFLLSLLNFPRAFKSIRSITHLSRLVCALFFYKKNVIVAIDQHPSKRHLFVKFFQAHLDFPFGRKKILGIVIAFNVMNPREVFEEQHVLEALRRIIPDVRMVKGSFLESQDKPNQVHTVYLEIEREDQSDFSIEEIRYFQKTLPNELKGCIEQLVPMTFMRRNEEEVYRTIVTLRDELKSIRDIPQATISFEEQTQFDLFFTVVLLRVVKEKETTIHELFTQHFPEIVLIFERIDHVGTLKKVYQKEASVFRLQLSKSAFFRKDRSVNLYKARRKVVSMLVKALGPIRDYNGGLILKQNERLEDFLAAMPKVYDEFLLENFFYSITPIAMQSILPPSLVREWFLAFSELFEKEMKRQEPFLLSCRHIEEATIVVVRTENSSFREELLSRINRLRIPSLELAFSEIDVHGTFYFGFLYRPSLIGKEKDFCQLVRQTMDSWSQKIRGDQILRLAIQSDELSLDPRIEKSNHSYIIIKMLFEGLTRIGLDGKPELAIAESYTVSSDYKRYTFYLRESKWSNGAPLTALDFEYSWKKALQSHSHSVFANSLSMIKNARLAKENKIAIEEVGVHARDEKTLEVELECPVPYFLEVAAHWTFSLINRLIDQNYPGWAHEAGETYVSNGPFKLVEWKHSRAVTVEKNHHYWDARSVKLNKIAVSLLERGQNEQKMLEKGELDIIGRPMSSYGGAEPRSAEIEKMSFPLNGVFILSFNAELFPFNHRKIRQAFAHAIDRQGIERIVSHEFDGLSFSLLPKTLSLNPRPLFPNAKIEKAKALFREGLGEIGFVKSDLPRLTLSFCSGMKRTFLFREILRQWKEVFDIDIHLEHADWDPHFKKLVQGKYQMAGVELHAQWGDPLHLLEFFEEKNDLLNISFWEHARYRELMQQARASPTLQERDTYLKEAEAFLAEEMPAFPLYQIRGNCLKNKGLKNVFPSQFFQIDFKSAYKDFEL